MIMFAVILLRPNVREKFHRNFSSFLFEEIWNYGVKVKSQMFPEHYHFGQANVLCVSVFQLQNNDNLLTMAHTATYFVRVYQLTTLGQ